jgi:hypothetical protein
VEEEEEARNEEEDTCSESCAAGSRCQYPSQNWESWPLTEPTMKKGMGLDMKRRPMREHSPAHGEQKVAAGRSALSDVGSSGREGSSAVDSARAPERRSQAGNGFDRQCAGIGQGGGRSAGHQCEGQQLLAAVVPNPGLVEDLSRVGLSAGYGILRWNCKSWFP